MSGQAPAPRQIAWFRAAGAANLALRTGDLFHGAACSAQLPPCVFLSLPRQRKEPRKGDPLQQRPLRGSAGACGPFPSAPATAEGNPRSRTTARGVRFLLLATCALQARAARSRRRRECSSPWMGEFAPAALGEQRREARAAGCRRRADGFGCFPGKESNPRRGSGAEPGGPARKFDASQWRRATALPAHDPCRARDPFEATA